MMERNNDIFLAGDDALGHLTGPIHKKIPWHLFVAINLVRADLMTDFSILPTFPCTHMYAFRVPQPFVYVISSILYSFNVLTLLVCDSFFILFYLRNSEIYDSP